HRELISGSLCPDPKCTGKVYQVSRPHSFIQFTGQPVISASQYLQEVVRCALCGKEYEAPLPEGVKPQKFDETAEAAIAINKELAARLFYWMAGLEEMCQIPPTMRNSSPSKLALWMEYSFADLDKEFNVSVASFSWFESFLRGLSSAYQIPACSCGQQVGI